MMDFLANVIPRHRLRPEVSRQIDMLANIPTRRARRYADGVVLKPLGINAILYRHSDYHGNHKLSFMRVAELGYSDIIGAAEQLVDDPGDLRVNRIDLAADLHGIS